MKNILLLGMTIFSNACATPSSSFPSHWFAAVEKESAASWEILPQDAKPGEVILSKRTELGLLSNFAFTPFVFHGKRYGSVEGFWQAMLYPEGKERTRVEGLAGFEAKAAGDLAWKEMHQQKINSVSFEGKTFPYETPERGEHYQWIVQAMRAKMNQNPAVKAVLKSTGSLKLRPDHLTSAGDPPAWKYYEIWEQLRSEL